MLNEYWSMISDGCTTRARRAMLGGASALGVFGLLLSVGSLPVSALVRHNTPTAEICDRAARSAATKTGVPFDVLRAVTRTETGRQIEGILEPWPWTVNMEGAGIWFRTLDGARSHVFQHFKTGARSFDVGCFQINYKWHHQAFQTIDDMFDPDKNALYAARFLQSLHAEFGDWPTAVGAFHSRNPTYATRYLKRFERIYASLPNGAQQTTSSRRPAGRFIVETGRTPLVSLAPRDVAEQSRTPGSLFTPAGRQSRPAKMFITLVQD